MTFKIYDDSGQWHTLIRADSHREAAVTWAQSRLWRSSRSHRTDHILVEGEKHIYKMQVLQLVHVEIEAVLTAYTCSASGQRDEIILENSADRAALQFMQRLVGCGLVAQGGTLDVKVSSKGETYTFRCTGLTMDPNGYVDVHIEEQPCKS